MSIYKRIKFHTLRYRGEILYASIIIGIFMLMIGIAFPSDQDAILGYVDILTEAGLDALLSTIDVNAPAWIFWVSLMSTFYTYIISAVAAIRIGSKLFPIEKEDALELIASSPKQSRTYYLENILASIIAMVLIFIPAFVILSTYSLIQDAGDTILRLTIMFGMNLVVSFFLISLSSVFSILRFSQSAGTRAGYLYVFIGFLIELGAGTSENYADFANISINSYISPTSGLLNGEHNWTAAGIVLTITAILFGMAYYFLNKPDYIEKETSSKQRFRLSFIPKFSPKGKLASNYPLLFDQFRKDRSYMFTWAVLVNFAIFYIAAIYNFALKDKPEILSSITSGFGGFLDAFTYGYEVPLTYAGFLSFEVFGLLWAYFGLFILFPAISIANRDQSNDEQDLIWSNSVTPERVILNRTLAIVIYFSIYFWITFLSLWSSVLLFELEMNVYNLLAVFGVGHIYFLGLILMLVGITMLFPLRNGRKLALWFYLISIMLVIISFIEPSVDYGAYLSIVYYYDPVGLILGEVEIAVQAFQAFVILVLYSVIYTVGLFSKYSKNDLLM